MYHKGLCKQKLRWQYQCWCMRQSVLQLLAALQCCQLFCLTGERQNLTIQDLWGINVMRKLDRVFFHSVCPGSILIPSSFLNFCWHMESNKKKKMGQALHVADLFLGLSARLAEFTDHIRLSTIPYGTAYHGHQQSYAEASIFHNGNLDPKSNICFKCIY